MTNLSVQPDSLGIGLPRVANSDRVVHGKQERGKLKFKTGNCGEENLSFALIENREWKELIGFCSRYFCLFTFSFFRGRILFVVKFVILGFCSWDFCPFFFFNFVVWKLVLNVWRVLFQARNFKLFLLTFWHYLLRVLTPSSANLDLIKIEFFKPRYPKTVFWFTFTTAQRR